MSRGFAAALRSLNNQMHAPQLLPIEFSLSIELNLSMRFDSYRIIKLFREPSAYWLHSNLDLQIAGNNSAGKRLDEYVKCSGANVGVSPQSNSTST